MTSSGGISGARQDGGACGVLLRDHVRDVDRIATRWEPISVRIKIVTLASAHRGYEYQDLLVALRLVDVMLGSIKQIYVDDKLIPNDRFDDLTTVDVTGCRERVQVKHTDNTDQPLTLTTFTNDARGLRLDCLISAALADRDSSGINAREHSFRIVLRDALSTDNKLLSVNTGPLC